MKYLASLIGLCFLLTPSLAFAAIAFDNSCTAAVASSGNTASCTITIGAAAHNCVMLGSQDANSGRIVQSVTIGGIAATVVESAYTGGTNVTTSLWYACGVPTGSQTVSVTANNSGVGGIQFDATSYTGVCQSAPIDSQSHAVKNAGTSPLNISTTVVKANSWLVASTNWNVLPAAGTGTTYRTVNKVNADSNAAVSSGSQSLQLTWSGSGTLTAIIASLAPDTNCASAASNFKFWGYIPF